MISVLRGEVTGGAYPDDKQEDCDANDDHDCFLVSGRRPSKPIKESIGLAQSRGRGKKDTEK